MQRRASGGKWRAADEAEAAGDDQVTAFFLLFVQRGAFFMERGYLGTCAHTCYY